ncbi:DUF6752 domain-containing protein [Nocardioides sp. R-C-SC26]|uniref:DUF6752 domain-containing protein n=1 Tax=Nocardioides sp. R-C-SC26 TaxID=2870414 RepID=UPI001E637487|nr:DUF6752 domain-containing protein [Nocardioides sp. R-C-SC26]
MGLNDSASDAATGDRSRARALMRFAPVRSRVDMVKLEERVRELEEAVRECRRHHHRTAELTDLVQALMVPLATSDRAALDRVLAEYTDQL